MDNRNKLSADPSALVLGIISISLLFFGFCCGFLVPFSLVLGIIGWIIAHKSLKECDEHREEFSPKSRSNVYTGKVLSIIGTIVSGIAVIVGVVCLILYGGEFMDKFNKIYHQEKHRQHDGDSIETKSVFKVEIDSVATDTAAEPKK